MDQLPERIEDVHPESPLGQSYREWQQSLADLSQAQARVEQLQEQCQEWRVATTLGFHSTDEDILAAMVAERRLQLAQVQLAELREAARGQDMTHRAAHDRYVNRWHRYSELAGQYRRLKQRPEQARASHLIGKLIEPAA